MTADLNIQKAALRKQIRASLQKISPAARETASAQARALLKEQSI
jgi:5-formyltetrahydrofolate cyclo-ligase